MYGCSSACRPRPGTRSVLDISLQANAGDLKRLLGAGARLRYFDHHAAGELPQHANLKAFIDTAPDTCTSLIVDRYLGGRQRLWAVVAAFGDNLQGPAQRAAAELDLDVRSEERRVGKECRSRWSP